MAALKKMKNQIVMGQDRECDYGMPLHDHQADDSRARKYNKGIFHVFPERQALPGLD